MSEITFIQLSKTELSIFLREEIRNVFKDIFASLKIKELEGYGKPHLTRKEAADFFDISLSCVDNWCNQGILEPHKVGNRTYFKKSDLIKVIFDP